MAEGPIDDDRAHVVWAIDDTWPCCSLCNDTGVMYSDVKCLCMGTSHLLGVGQTSYYTGGVTIYHVTMDLPKFFGTHGNDPFKDDTP